jgi:hypothetical protein
VGVGGGVPVTPKKQTNKNTTPSFLLSIHWGDHFERGLYTADMNNFTGCVTTTFSYEALSLESFELDKILSYPTLYVQVPENTARSHYISDTRQHL